MSHGKTILGVFMLICLTGPFAFSQSNQSFSKLSGVFGETFANPLLPKIKSPGKSGSKSNREIPETSVYEHLFRLINRFEKQAARQENLGNGRGARLLRSYIERTAELDSRQASYLKTTAGEFFGETQRFEARGKKLIASKRQFSSIDKYNAELDKLERQRTELSLSYRQKLREFFGAADFERFAAFVREKIQAKMAYFNTPGNMWVIGMSEVFYDSGTIYGYSSSEGQNLMGYCDPEKGEQCPHTTIVATLSSELEGGIDMQMADVCGGYVDVDFYVSEANYSDTYCINGEHSYEEHDPYCAGWGIGGEGDKHETASFNDTSEDCVDTPWLTVSGVSFEVIAQGSTAIDANPIGEGQRVFPDDNSFQDNANRQRIRVKATLSDNIAGETIYFRNFDLDDPSSNTTIDPNGTTGDDNNGSVNNSSAGQLHQTSAVTNSMGVASVEFSVTMQPGDNFAIAASRTLNYVNGISVNGTQLRHGTTTIDTACGDGDLACRSEMLTVWRRLHIEVDSMDEAQGNYVDGTFADDYKIGTSYATIQVNPQTLEAGRFENGRLTAGAATLQVSTNTANTLTVRSTTGAVNVSNGGTFRLYDDDDFNDDGIKDGDTGDDIPRPDTSLISNTGEEATNVLAPAYILPVYDLAGESDTVTFTANTGETQLTSLFTSNTVFNNVASHADTEFWTIYLLGAYQFRTDWDGDPNTFNALGELLTTYGAANTGERQTVGHGAALFTEEGRPSEYPSNWATRPVSRAHTIAHEVGHLFGCVHADGGLMEVTTRRQTGTFTPDCINQIRRNATHP